MKSASDIFNSAFSNAKAFKSRAAQLKRIASGVSTEIQAAERTDLSDGDLKALEKAVHILEILAERYAGAAKLKAKQEQEWEKRGPLVKKAMHTTFGRLSSVEDKIAIIAMYKSSALRIGIQDLADLKFHFEDALDGLWWTLVKDLTRKPEVAIAEAWERFSAERQQIIDKNRPLIQSFAKLGKD